MAVAGIYRRALPSPPAIEFSSSEGKELFSEALCGGTMEGFFKLISNFQTQSETAYCGLASLAMVLNALLIDPGKKWRGSWRWYDESMLDCCGPLEKIKAEGTTFGKVACLAHCAGSKVEAFRTSISTTDNFRDHVIQCTSSEDCHMIATYHRKAFKQTGGGHFSPIGGYHAGKDMVLILDVARFKYPPHWVPLTLLWEAMDTIDNATGHSRGYMIISKHQKVPSLLYTLNCRHESWLKTAQYFLDDVPNILKSEDLKNVGEVLSFLFHSLPSDVRDFITLVTETENGRLALKEKVLQEVQDTELYKLVSSVKMHQASTDLLTVLLMALPTDTWSSMRYENVLSEMHALVSTHNLPEILKDEVLHLRKQMYFLKRCKDNNVDDCLDVPSAFNQLTPIFSIALNSQ